MTKHVVVFILVGIVGAFFYSKRKHELASNLQWNFFIYTVFISPVFGTLSSGALSQTFLQSLLEGQFFGKGTVTVYLTWGLAAPILLIILNLGLYFGVFKRVQTTNLHTIPAKVVKISIIFMAASGILIIILLYIFKSQ